MRTIALLFLCWLSTLGPRVATCHAGMFVYSDVTALVWENRVEITGPGVALYAAGLHPLPLDEYTVQPVDVGTFTAEGSTRTFEELGLVVTSDFMLINATAGAAQFSFLAQQPYLLNNPVLLARGEGVAVVTIGEPPTTQYFLAGGLAVLVAMPLAIASRRLR